jgi:hypothetical protein
MLKHPKVSCNHYALLDNSAVDLSEYNASLMLVPYFEHLVLHQGEEKIAFSDL